MTSPTENGHPSTAVIEGIEAPAPPTIFATIFAIICYMLSSISIVYFNRILFTNIYPYPVFISWIQQLFGIVLYYCVALAGYGTGIPTLRRFHLEKIDPYVSWQTLPQVISFTLMVAFSNVCLEYVQVSTYQVARSLTLLFSIILAKIMLGTLPHNIALVGAALIFFGVIVGSLDPSTLSLFGLALGGCSSFFQAINGILVSKNMIHFDNDGQRLLLYNMFGAVFTMFPLIFIFGETDAFWHFPLDPMHPDFGLRWIGLIGSGVFCILINLTTMICISLTSPVSMTVIGFSKAILQSIGGIAFLGDITSIESVASLLLSLGGTGVYSFGQIKSKKGEVKEANASPITLQRLEEGEEIVESPRMM